MVPPGQVVLKPAKQTRCRARKSQDSVTLRFRSPRAWVPPILSTIAPGSVGK